MRNKKIKLLENAVQARDAKIEQSEKKEKKGRPSRHTATPTGSSSELRTELASVQLELSEVQQQNERFKQAILFRNHKIEALE